MTPGRGRVAEVLATATIVLVVGAGGLGIVRWLSARDHREAVLESVEEAAAQAAITVADKGADAAETDMVAGIAVVRTGAVDEFGIERDAEVALDHVTDPRCRPADEKQFERFLLNRNAELATFLGADGKGAIPDDRRIEIFRGAGGQQFAAAIAPVMGKDGKTHEGMVRVVVAMDAPPEVVPLWMLLAGIVLAGLVMLVLLRYIEGAMALRASAGGVAAVATGAALFSGGSPALWSALAAGLLGALAVPGLGRLYRGIRRQPGTYGYILPAMLSMVVLVFIPFFMGIGLAFFDSSGNFRGFSNFTEVLFPSETSDINFWWTLFITIIWTVSNVVLHVTIGLTLALVLNRPDLRFKGVYRVLLIVPWAVPNYVTALIWKWMFNTQYGAVNALLAAFGVEPIDWLGESVLTNFLANLTTNTWLGFPFMMVVSLGALQSIPKDLYEAAHIDGASKWQAFRHVTLPLLKPAMIPAVILGTVWTFNMFNIIYLVSGGAPGGKTDILITQAYYAFKVLKRFGLAAAYALIIFVILLLFGVMTNRISKAAEGVYE